MARIHKQLLQGRRNAAFLILWVSGLNQAIKALENGFLSKFIPCLREDPAVLKYNL